MPNDDALLEWQQRCYQLVTENEGLKQQLANVQRLLRGSTERGEYVEQQLAQATDLIRRFYGSFRWEVNTDPQEAACKDAEVFLNLPAEKRREWSDGE